LDGETIKEIAETARIEDRNYTTGKKYHTYDLAQAILNELDLPKITR
jgi:ferritin-like protein